MKPLLKSQIILEDDSGAPFLIMSIRDAISREVAEFLELVPRGEEALHLLMGALDRGFEIHRRRAARGLIQEALFP